MVTVNTNILQKYQNSPGATGISSDLDLNFTSNPITGDISRNKGETAIINAIKNLVLMMHFDVPFQPDIGSNVRKLLFENMDVVIASTLEREIREVVQNYEPRVSVNSISVKPNFEHNYFQVDLNFSVINMPKAMTINFQLKRLR